LKIDLHTELKEINLKYVVLYLNEKQKMAQNKRHHEIPNFFKFIFQFLDPGYLTLIHYEKRIYSWYTVSISKNPKCPIRISKFFPQHPESLRIFILFFMASLCRDLPIETISIY